MAVTGYTRVVTLTDNVSQTKKDPFLCNVLKDVWTGNLSDLVKETPFGKVFQELLVEL